MKSASNALLGSLAGSIPQSPRNKLHVGENKANNYNDLESEPAIDTAKPSPYISVAELDKKNENEDFKNKLASIIAAGPKPNHPIFKASQEKPADATR